VGVHDHFFELGGHSLLATQVLSRLPEAFGVELPLHRFLEVPTIAQLARTIRTLRQTQQRVAAPPLRPVPRDRVLPLSFAQQRLWFLHQLEPESPVYNLPVAFHLHGLLGRTALAEAIAEIVRRHEVLRTRLSEQDDQPVQVIAAAEPMPLPVVDLTPLSVPQREREIERLKTAEARRPFRLDRTPLLRAGLIRCGAEEHVLELTIHHVAADGWSMGILYRELAALYDAYRKGQPSPLPEPTLQYADFAVWQREWLEGGSGSVWERQLRYWKAQLQGMSELELLADRPRGRRAAVGSERGVTLRVELGGELTAALRALGRDAGTTVFMTLLAGFHALLGRHTGQVDVAVASVIANRGRPELEGMIGFFVNTLLLRTDAGGDPRFDELLERTRRTALGAYAHQELPFERLVAELQPKRDLNRQPLFQIMFVLQNTPGPGMCLPGLEVEEVPVESGTAMFDLAFSLREDGAGIGGEVELDSDRFDVTTIRRLVERWRILLEAAVAEPQRRLSELPLVSAAERHQTLYEWSDPSFWPSWELPQATLGELLAARAARTPAAVAVRCGDQVLSYGEVNIRANRLAHRLSSLGVAAEVAVGLVAEHGPEVVVALLGILKAGGVFLPLDPTHPAERLAFMLRDAGARVVLVEETSAASLPPAAEHDARVVMLDQPPFAGRGSSLASESAPVRRSGAREMDEKPPFAGEDEPGPCAELDNLAYVIYTSGTTGMPKGVAVSHRQVLPILFWFLRTFPINERTRVLRTLSYCFDFGLFELLSTLLAGGTLCLLPAAEQGDLRRYLDAIERYGLNTVHATPSFFRELIAPARPLPGVEIVHLGGEALSRELVRRIRAVADGCRVYNGYGPTEASINSAIYPVVGRIADGGPTLPIGRPTAGNSARVPDRGSRPLPIGVAGELLIGGEGLARGYLKQPALTAERFTPDPFAERAGARLYRTGDLVRWLPDGNLEFLGRIDHQVKIRGLRIELGEIEETLGRHPGVRQAVVIATPEPGRRLVAYVVRAGDDALAAGELRRWLGERLPASMVPQAVIFPDALPRTATGKVNRRALPAADDDALAAEAEFVAPRHPVEELLAGIWTEVLGTTGPVSRRVGIHDDFFELGGHSLLATQVISRIGRVLGVGINPRVIFECPTVAALAVEVARQSAAQRATRIEPLVPVGRSGPLPLSFAQARLWYLDQLDPQSTAYNSTVPLFFRGSLDPQALQRAFTEIVRRHEALRTTFAIADSQPVQVISPAGEHPLPRVDLRALAERDRKREAEHLLRRDQARHFDLARGPLFCTTLLRLADDTHVLSLSNHHIVFDGWSSSVLFRELQQLYRALVRGEPSPLDPLPIQYADFACWQQRFMSGEALERQLAWWRAALGSRPKLARLAADHPRSGAAAAPIAGRHFRLGAESSEALRRLARRQGATLYMTLMAAVGILLHRHTGERAVTVGTLIANRNHYEIENLIGFFVNTQVIRIDFRGQSPFDGPSSDNGPEGAPSKRLRPTAASEKTPFCELLDRVREMTLGAYDHQDLPFEKLVEALRPERSADPQPLFQVLFVLQNTPSPPRELPGVTLSFRPMEGSGGTLESSRAAAFDLLVEMAEDDEGLSCILGYDRSLFEPATIDILADHFRNLLEEIAADPDRPVEDLPLMPEGERRQLLERRIDAGSEMGSRIRDRLPQGMPETACRTYLLDRELGLTPTCGVGEIYLELEGTAVAAIGSPATAAATLRPHPFAREPGACLCATGLRGRWRADAKLELVDAPPPPAAARARAGAGERPAVPGPAIPGKGRDERRERVTARRGQLSATRRALLAQRLRGHSRSEPRPDPIPRRRPDEPAVPSFAQERLLFLDLLEPGLPAYNLPVSRRLRGRLSPAALAAGFDALRRRHEVLRSRFPSAGDGFTVEIAPPVPQPLPVVDLSALPAALREEVAARVVGLERARPFDLARGPLLRTALLRLAGEDHVLFLNCHHVIFDGASLGILFRELGGLCAAFAGGGASALPELPIQYADFALWQRRHLAGGVLEAQLGYWRERLAGAPPTLDLPADRPRPAVRRFRGELVTLTTGRPTVERLRGLAQEAEATPFMVLVAAFQVILGRSTGERDVVVGTPVAGRNRAETEGLIGLFLNTVVLRSDLSGNAIFRRLLEQVRETTLGAFAHQDLPFEMLVRELSPRRDLSRSPLFQVFFNHVVEESTPPALPGFTVDEMPHRGKPFSKFDLTLYATEARDHLKIELVYDAALFDRPRMAALGAAYADLLEQIAADPYRGIADYSLRATAAHLPDPRLLLSAPDPATTPPELVPAGTARAPGQPVGNQLLPFLRRHGINPGDEAVQLLVINPRGELCGIGELGEIAVRLARSAPDDEALGDERFTFNPWRQDARDLLCKSGELGRYRVDGAVEFAGLLPDPRAPLPAKLPFEPVASTFLGWAEREPEQVAVRCGERRRSYRQLAGEAAAIARRLGPEARGRVAAISGERGPELVASLLAVMLAGGVPLLLDGKLPPARRRLMLAEAGARQLILAGATDPDPEAIAAPEIAVLRVPRTDAPPAAAALPAAVEADDPAYIFFTSGTTGIPKGVLGRHQGLSHFLAWQREAFAVAPGDRVAQLTSLSFDVVLRDLFLPLTSGATLEVPPDDDLSPVTVLPWMERCGITLLHTVPSLAAAWLADVPPDVGLRTLRWVFFAGEPLADVLIRRWRRSFPGTGGIANLYGPTETTLAKCCYVVPDPPGPGIQPIGSPLPHTQALILDRDGRPCGIGELGEIVLRTPYRSLGYLNDAAENARRFRPHPGGGSPGETVYFTGDAGRYRPDGLLSIHGRLDDQVKIRGMRVEPAEIKAVLESHPRVRESVVLAREHDSGERRLLAWMTLGESVAPGALRQWLEQRVPAYMVPAAFVVLERLPLLPNGKVDRRALPEPQAEAEISQVPARGPVESQLVRIFEEVLGTPVGVGDDFFERGGHSLLAVRLLARVREQFGRALPLVTLFERPTVKQLAELVTRRDEPARPWSPLVEVRPGTDPEKPPFFCVHPAGGSVLVYAALARHLGGEQAFYGLQARGIDGHGEPFDRIEEMAACYLEAVRQVQPAGPYFLGGWSLGGTVAFEMARRLQQEGEAVALLAIVDIHARAFSSVEELDTTDLLMGMIGEWLPVTAEELRGLEPDDQLAHALGRAQEIGALPASYGMAEARRLLEVYEANLAARRSFAPRPYPGRIDLFRAREQPPDAPADPTMGWAEVADRVEVHGVPGSHQNVVREPHVRELARQLGSCLAAAQG